MSGPEPAQAPPSAAAAGGDTSLREILQRLGKSIAGYGLVQWSGPLLSFIFTPIITRILNPSDYGIADYALTIAGAAGTLALFALPQALTAHFNDQRDEQWQRRVTGSALLLVLLIGVPVGIALALLAPLIAESSFRDIQYAQLFVLIGTTFGFGLCANVLTTSAQAAMRVRMGMVFGLVSILSTVAGNVLYIVVQRLGATGMILTSVSTGAVQCITTLWLMRGRIGRPSSAIVQMLFRSGAVLVPFVIASWALQVIDRLFLVYYVSTTELGYYSIANRIAALLYVAMAPFYSAWIPVSLAIEQSTRARERLAIVSRYIVAVVLSASLGLGLFAAEILIVLTRPAYLPASSYVGFLTYMYVFATLGSLLMTGAMISKQLGSISWTTLVGAGVNITLNFVLIPTYGVWGAVAATVIGYAIGPALLYIYVQRQYPIPYQTTILLSALAVQAGLMLAGMAVPALNFPIRVGIKLVLFLLFPVALVVLRVVTPFELRQARSFATTRLLRAVSR